MYIPAFGHKGLFIQPTVARYGNGNVAVTLELQSGEPYARLSINIPHAALEPDEFVVNHDCNDIPGLLSAAKRSGFIDTGKLVHYGFSDDLHQPIWRLPA